MASPVLQPTSFTQHEEATTDGSTRGLATPETADGATLAFTFSIPAANPKPDWLRAVMICGLDQESGQGRLLACGSSPTEMIEDASWSRNVQTLLVTMRRLQFDATDTYSGDVRSIARYDLLTVTRTQVIEDAFAPVRAADGKHLANIRDAQRSGTLELTVSAGDGQDRQPPRPQPPFGAILAPRWSPGSSRLLFTASRGPEGSAKGDSPSISPLERLFGVSVVEAHGETARLWIAGSDSSKLQPLTPESTDDPRGAWSPDGQRVVYVAGNSSGAFRITILDLDTMQEQRLANTGGYGGITRAPR